MERDFLGLSSREPLVMVNRSPKVVKEIQEELNFTDWPMPSYHYPDVGTQGIAFCAPVARPLWLSDHANNILLTSHSTTSVNAVEPRGGTDETATGYYAMRSDRKEASRSSQLTIFYRGAVNVYDNVSAEKARAIMFLATKGSKGVAKPPAIAKAEPGTDLSGSVSVLSTFASRSGNGSGDASEMWDIKGAHPCKHLEYDPKVSTSQRSSPVVAAGVPQARRASLARFLEKRKERLENAAPYSATKKVMVDAVSEVDGESASASASASAASTPVSGVAQS